MSSKKKILVVVEGGNVSHVVGVPEGVEVIVRDYDIVFDDYPVLVKAKSLRMVDGEFCIEGHYPGPDGHAMVESVVATKKDIE